jgi:hypothetical protein
MKKITLVITPELYAQLGLVDGADEAAVGASLKALGDKAAKVDSLNSENTRLSNENRTMSVQIDTLKGEHEATAVKAILDKAVTDKKVSAAMRTKLEASYKGKSAELQELVDTMTPYASITGSLKIDDNTGTGGDIKRYEGKSWDELDKANLLPDMKAEFPQVYAQVFEKKFGRKPNA